jgi:hypothetical protein
MIAKPIFDSHASIIKCILGWGDKIYSQVPKVEGVNYDGYAKCG